MQQFLFCQRTFPHIVSSLTSLSSPAADGASCRRCGIYCPSFAVRIGNEALLTAKAALLVGDVQTADTAFRIRWPTSFPSTTDLSHLWKQAPALAKKGNLLAIVSLPLAGLLVVLNFLRVVWADLGYGIAVGILGPLAIFRALAH